MPSWEVNEEGVDDGAVVASWPPSATTGGDLTHEITRSDGGHRRSCVEKWWRRATHAWRW